MRFKHLLASLVSLSAMQVISAQTDAFGYKTMNATTGPSYQNRVFVDLSAEQMVGQAVNNWDIAFFRNSSTSAGTRINDAQGIETYLAAVDPLQWDTINVANIGTWGAPLYNPDITENLQNGALEQANLTCNILSTGWGCYNIANHHIEGKSIYVLKYPDGSFIKFMITDYYGGYTFKYAKYSGGTWGTTVTKTISNGSDDAYFNYYSLINDASVTNMEPPKANWDFMLTRYWTFYNNIMMYRMSGILQSPRIMVAKATETQATSSVAIPTATSFFKNIATIGHSWKTTSGLVPDTVYYIKEDNTYYRLYFIENGGATTGNMTFKYKDISSVLSTTEQNAKVTFGIYPNPSPNKQVTLLYDVKEGGENRGVVTVLDQAGRKVYETTIEKSQGFFKKELNLQQLSSGTYLVNLQVGQHSETKKMILK